MSAEKFCQIIRKRSAEHVVALERIQDLPGIISSIIRQELDSMIRAIYLLSIDDPGERNRLINQTLNGERWTVTTTNGNTKFVTDREMAELSDKLHGWTLSVYKFGCAFIHLSRFHDYSDKNPFELLEDNERKDILNHLRQYHNGPEIDHPSFEELSTYFPAVFEKISGNLGYYLEEIEKNASPNCL